MSLSDGKQNVGSAAYGTRTIYALLSNQGTAMAETALCATHEQDEDCRFEACGNAPYGDGPDDAPFETHFVDCSENDALACIICES